MCAMLKVCHCPKCGSDCKSLQSEPRGTRCSDRNSLRFEQRGNQTRRPKSLRAVQGAVPGVVGGGTRVARHEQLKCIVLRAFSAGHSRGRTQRAAARPARERGVSSFLASAAFCLLSPLDPVGDAGSARQHRVPRQWHREPSWLT